MGFSFSGSKRRLRRTNGKSNNHLMHLQVDVRRPHLGVQVWVVGISGVVLQAAALLQVGLELLSAPPTGRDKKKKVEREFISESTLITIS